MSPTVYGKNISNANVQTISDKGVWILVKDEAFFMPFEDFPWFLKASIGQIYNLQLFHGHHVHWPDLDIDVDMDYFKHPESYPLRYSG